MGLEEYNKMRAIAAYKKGKASIGRAAEIAGVSIAGFYKILEDEGMSIQIDMGSIEEALEADFGKE